MNEEQAVLDFFAKDENLPLGLAVAEQMDTLRTEINSRFWLSLQNRLNTTFAAQEAEFYAEPVEDRNQSDMLVGLQCRISTAQTLYLFPVLEQQFLGGKWRIFFGLMWNTPPSATQLSLPAVAALKLVLDESGFKSNENFLAWQWCNLYPRRSDFLLRYTHHSEKLFAEIETVLHPLLCAHRKLISLANAALQDTPRSMTISLDQLRRAPQR